MEKNEEYILGRIIWKAKKYQLPSEYAFFFNDLLNDKKDFFLRQINVDASGSPAILFTTPTDAWTLICAKQVLWYKEEKVNAVAFSEIEKMISNALDKLQQRDKLESVTKNPKSEYHELAVYDRMGNKHILNADKGQDLFALWNILLMVMRVSKSKPNN